MYDFAPAGVIEDKLAHSDFVAVEQPARRPNAAVGHQRHRDAVAKSTRSASQTVGTDRFIGLDGESRCRARNQRVAKISRRV